MNATIHSNGEVRITLLKNETGQYSRAIVYINPNGAHVILGDGYPSTDAAKSAAWQFAQDHNAIFVPTRRVRS